MADGSSKPIERIEPGEMVLAASDGDPEGPVEPRRVVEVYHNRPERLLRLEVGGLVIRCTLKHPFYVRHKGWTAAGELLIGDELRTHDGRWAKLTATEDRGEVEPVYNFHVEGYHTYFVGDLSIASAVLVHNDSGGVGSAQEEEKWYTGTIWDYTPGLTWIADNWFSDYDAQKSRAEKLQKQSLATDPNRILRAGDFPSKLNGRSQLVNMAEAGEQIDEFIRDRKTDVALEAATLGVGKVLGQADDVAKLARTAKKAQNASRLTREAADALRAEARAIWESRTGRRAIWDGMDVHHRIPLEWSHLFPNANSNRAANLLGIETTQHPTINAEWAAFKTALNSREPTAVEVLRKAMDIDKKYGHLFRFLP